ncbi:MAG TPA: hypothetical protein DD433_02710 [Ruminococcaceae bacterium]|nr:hypothetical protein [Oscillospiraceae bacterium]
MLSACGMLSLSGPKKNTFLFHRVVFFSIYHVPAFFSRGETRDFSRRSSLGAAGKKGWAELTARRPHDIVKNKR